LPGRAAIVGPEGARRRDRDEHPLRVARIDQDGVKTEAARARLPVWSGAVIAQPGQLVPVPAAVGRAKHRRVFHAGIHRVGIRLGRLEVPDAFEFPRVWRSVVPLMGARDAVIRELVVDRLPGLAAVARSLDELTEPARALRCVQPVRIGRRALQVVHLPAAEMRALDAPLLPFAIRSQDERALARSHQHANSAHHALLRRLGRYPRITGPAKAGHYLDHEVPVKSDTARLMERSAELR